LKTFIFISMAAPLNEERFWKEMTEGKLVKLMKNYYKDLVDLNEENKYSEIDWYIPSLNTFIEYKGRNDSYPGYYIEKPKWEALIQKENGWYLNSTPTEKLIYWNIPQLDWDPVWVERLLPETTEFGEPIKVLKTITTLYPYQGEQFHYHLLY